MARSYSTDDTTLADAQVIFHKAASGMQMKVVLSSTDGGIHLYYDEDLSAALTAMVNAGTITGAQRTAFLAVAQELRRRARTALNMVP